MYTYRHFILMPSNKPVEQELKEEGTIVLQKKNSDFLAIYSRKKEEEKLINLKNKKTAHLSLLDKIKSDETLKLLGYTEETEIEDKRDSYEKIQDGIDESFAHIDSAKGKDLVLVLGLTGAGKSTTVNYLIRHPMEVDEAGEVVPVGDPPAPMGSSASSVTTYPKTYEAPGRKFFYCDCPGFEDTRDDETRVSVSLNTEATVKAANKIMAVMVVIELGTIEVERGAGLKRLAPILGHLFHEEVKGARGMGKEAFDMAKSLIFVITKTNDRNLAYCEKQIRSNLVAQQKRLREEKSKLEKSQSEGWGLESVYPSKKGAGSERFEKKQSNKSKQQERIVNDLELAVSMLTLMSDNSKNIIMTNIFDRGETRELIEKKVCLMQYVRKEVMNFNETDPVRHEFCQKATGEIIQAIDHITKLYDLPQEIKANYEYEAKKQEEIKKYKAQIEDIESGRVYKGEKDQRVVDNKTTIADNKKNSLVIREKMSELEHSLDDAKRELSMLDTSDEVLFYENSKKKRRVSAITNSMKKPLLETRITGIGLVDDTLEGVSFYGAVALSPLTILYGGLRRLSHDLEYKGAPFIRVKEHGAGTFTRTVYKPEEGEYRVHYESDRGRAGAAEIEVYGEKRNRPGVKARIEVLKLKIEELKASKKRIAAQLDELEETNKSLELMNMDIIKDVKRDIRKEKQKVTEIITRTQASLEQMQQTITEKEKELRKEDEYCKNKTPFWATIAKLAAFINFRNEGCSKDTLDKFIKHFGVSTYAEEKSKEIPKMTMTTTRPPALPTSSAPPRRAVDEGSSIVNMRGQLFNQTGGSQDPRLFGVHTYPEEKEKSKEPPRTTVTTARLPDFPSPSALPPPSKPVGVVSNIVSMRRQLFSKTDSSSQVPTSLSQGASSVAKGKQSTVVVKSGSST